ncbi:MAG: Fic family protein [Propionibacteriaceae bacterium]|jgi:cell filamentation protein|nr:Fic family protein [Propionibacteriaceae bacterium]
MESPEFVDPYVDPETGVLKNLVGAVTREQLAQAEADFVVPRLLALDDLGKVPFNLEGMCKIHHFLFQDLFGWAGHVRLVDIRKNEEGAQFFLPVSFIQRASDFAASELAGENNLKGLNREEFIRRLAYHYDQWNYIHPFREGNGRTQRVFWGILSEEAGWLLEWQPVLGKMNDEASRLAAEDEDRSALEEMFKLVVKPL